MNIKLLTINIWRYFDWDKRKSESIKLFKKYNADIILLQEAAFDERLNYKNQVDEINQELKYKHYAFGKIADMHNWNKIPIDWVMYFGFGIITKYPILKTQIVKLKPVIKERPLGFFYIQVQTPEGKLDLINVHFENTDQGSESNLIETLSWCKKNHLKPIIAGDFNIINTEILIKHSQKDYEISYLFKPYKSYMPTEFSSNKEPVTLDYILLSKDHFSFKNLNCIKSKASDHYPIYSEIEKIK